MITQDCNRFVLVGLRFSEYFYDEKAIRKSQGSKLVGVFNIQAQEPLLSEAKYRDRPVIEIAVSIACALGDSSAIDKKSAAKSAISPDSKKKKSLTNARAEKARKGERVAELEIFHLVCVGGFVGADVKDDGNLEAFRDHAEAYNRAVYWLARQRVKSLTTQTLLSEMTPPWDLATIKSENIARAERLS